MLSDLAVLIYLTWPQDEGATWCSGEENELEKEKTLNEVSLCHFPVWKQSIWLPRSSP